MEVFRQANRQALPSDGRDVYARASAHANEALRIDPQSVQAHVMLAYASAWIDDIAAFKHHAQQVMQLNPNEPDAYELASDLYLLEGRMDEALAARKRVTELDPLEPIGQANYARALAAAGRPAQALQEAGRAIAIAIDPNDNRIVAAKADILLDLGRKAEALALARQVAAKEPPGPLRVLAALGSPQELAAIEKQALKPRDRAYLDLYRGRTVAFLEWLNTGAFFGDRAGALFNPALDPVRNTPGFKAWLEKHGLTKAQDRALAWRMAQPPAPTKSR
jgi:tetratricopeptide (TPR) repeat protein